MHEPPAGRGADQHWLFKDNRTVSCAALADLLANHPDVTSTQLRMLQCPRAPSRHRWRVAKGPGGARPLGRRAKVWRATGRRRTRGESC